MSKAVIVESSAYWATVLAQLLAQENVEVVQSFNKGSGWLAGLPQLNADMIFVDDQLVNRPGLEAIDRLSSLGSFTGEIVFTHDFEGIGANVLEKSALIVGADYCLQKPYRRQSVRRLVQMIK